LKDKDKTKEQLIVELLELRQQVATQKKLEEDLKQAEKALKESREKYKTIIENLSEIIQIVDSEGVISYVSPSVQRILGYKPEEVIGRPSVDFVHPDDLQKVSLGFEEAYKKPDKPTKVACRCKHKNGTWRVIEGIGTNCFDKPSINGFLSVMQDITERKRNEEALHNSEEFSLSLLSNSPYPILVINADTSIKYVNPAMERLTGFSSADIVGIKAPYPWWTEETLKKTSRDLKQAFQKGAGQFEESFQKKNGDRFQVEITSRPVIQEGKLKYYLAMCVDISERKQAEEELKSSEERLKIMFEYAPDAYYLNDRKGTFIDGNIAAEEITGYKKEELIGKSFLKLKLLPTKMIPKAAKLLALNIIGKPTGPNEFVLNRKDGTQVPVEIMTYPVKIKGKMVALGIARDITERKKTEEKMKASLKEKEVLLKEIHHRVKNNMQIISSLLNLQSAKIKDKNMQEIYKVSQDRIRTMALIHEKLYKSEDLASINFAKYIQSLTVHLFHSYRVNTDIVRLNTDIEDIHLDINTAIPCALIINELVSNSLKHAFPGGKRGEITVKLHSDKQGKRTLVVSDNGIGFPEDFDLQKSDSLGLLLVTDLTKQINGTIKFDRIVGVTTRIVF